MVKCSLFMENKGSDGNHILDETIILLSVSCHSQHSEGKMETCTPLFNFFTTIFHPHPPIFQLAISVISAAVVRSDAGARKSLYRGVQAFVMRRKSGVAIGRLPERSILNCRRSALLLFFCQFNTWLKPAGQLPFIWKETGRAGPERNVRINPLWAARLLFLPLGHHRG